MDIVKELGLKPSYAGLFCGNAEVVCVQDLRSALDKLPVVYCSKPDEVNSHLWAHREASGYDTHKARLLGVETIVREPLRREYETIMNTKTHLDWAEFVGKRVKVVVTEIQEGE